MEHKGLWLAMGAPVIPAFIDFMKGTGAHPTGSGNVLGQEVIVNFNRNRSHFRRAAHDSSWPTTDQLHYYCYAIRAKKRGDWRVAGYSEDFAIRNASPKVNASRHYITSGYEPDEWKGRNIPEQGSSRSVFSFLSGTAVSLSSLPDRPPDGFAHYSPFPPGIPSEYFVIPNRRMDLERFDKSCLVSIDTFPWLKHAEYAQFTQGVFGCGIAPILLWGITDKQGEIIVGDGTPYVPASTIREREYPSVKGRKPYRGPKRPWIPRDYFPS